MSQGAQSLTHVSEFAERGVELVRLRLSTGHACRRTPAAAADIPNDKHDSDNKREGKCCFYQSRKRHDCTTVSRGVWVDEALALRRETMRSMWVALKAISEAQPEGREQLLRPPRPRCGALPEGVPQVVSQRMNRGEVMTRSDCRSRRIEPRLLARLGLQTSSDVLVTFTPQTGKSGTRC